MLSIVKACEKRLCEAVFGEIRCNNCLHTFEPVEPSFIVVSNGI